MKVYRNFSILYITESQLLKQKCQPVNLPAQNHIYELVEKMKHAIQFEDYIWTGFGLSLAAPQLGKLQRLFIYTDLKNKGTTKQYDKFHVIVNPQIVQKSSIMTKDWEGCLSIPEIECLVSRHETIQASYFDLKGKKYQRVLNGLEARIFQHELDHLDGKIMTQIAEETKPIKF